MALIAGAGLCMLSVMSSSFGGLIYYLRDPEPATPMSGDDDIPQTQTTTYKKNMEIMYPENPNIILYSAPPLPPEIIAPA